MELMKTNGAKRLLAEKVGWKCGLYCLGFRNLFFSKLYLSFTSLSTSYLASSLQYIEYRHRYRIPRQRFVCSISDTCAPSWSQDVTTEYASPLSLSLLMNQF